MKNNPSCPRTDNQNCSLEHMGYYSYFHDNQWFHWFSGGFSCSQQLLHAWNCQSIVSSKWSFQHFFCLRWKKHMLFGCKPNWLLCQMVLWWIFSDVWRSKLASDQGGKKSLVVARSSCLSLLATEKESLTRADFLIALLLFLTIRFDNEEQTSIKLAVVLNVFQTHVILITWSAF